MEARAKLLGHPIHQMLIVFPLGLLATAVLFDVISLVRGTPGWAASAYHMIIAGVVGGLAAALFGFIDWTKIPAGTRAKSVGLWHGLGNVVVVVLFAASWFMRRDHPVNPGTGEIVLEVVAVALSLVTAWMGGELVDRLGVGVDSGAHVDAPSSLSGKPARAS